VKFGPIAESLLEQLALGMGRVPIPLIDVLFGPMKARAIMAMNMQNGFAGRSSRILRFFGQYFLQDRSWSTLGGNKITEHSRARLHKPRDSRVDHPYTLLYEVWFRSI
jgi:hypothetical protein